MSNECVKVFRAFMMRTIAAVQDRERTPRMSAWVKAESANDRRVSKLMLSPSIWYCRSWKTRSVVCSFSCSFSRIWIELTLMRKSWSKTPKKSGGHRNLIVGSACTNFNVHAMERNRSTEQT